MTKRDDLELAAILSLEKWEADHPDTDDKTKNAAHERAVSISQAISLKRIADALTTDPEGVDNRLATSLFRLVNFADGTFTLVDKMFENWKWPDK